MHQLPSLIQAINSILLFYSWIVAAILILLLSLIGRFYEIKFGQQSHYRLFLFPLVCFAVAAVWYTFFARDSATRGDFVGALGPDLLLLVGGLALIGLGYTLFRTMMGGRR